MCVGGVRGLGMGLGVGVVSGCVVSTQGTHMDPALTHCHGMLCNAALDDAVLCCAVTVTLSITVWCLQVRKPKRPARLAALPDLTAAGLSADAATGLSGTAERLNASHHPALQWPEFGHLLDKLAAAAAAAARGGRRGRAAAADGAAAPGLLLGAGGPVPAAVLDWNDAAAAEAAEQAAIEQHQDDMTAGGRGHGDISSELWHVRI